MVWEVQERHNARALYRFGQLALVFRGSAGTAARQDLTVGIDELFQKFNILVVNFFNVIALKIALLLLFDTFCHRGKLVFKREYFLP